MQDWKAQTLAMRRAGKSWRELYRAFPGVKPTAIRSHIRRNLTETDIETQPTAATNAILDALKAKKSVTCESAGLSARVLDAIIDDLRDEGYLIGLSEGVYRLLRDVAPEVKEYTKEWAGERVVRFGVVSDTHLCSKYQQLTALNQMYDVFADEGIADVYHAGDLTDGSHMRKGHEYETFLLGADEQTDYVVDKYPRRDGITTQFILGNHDASHIKNGGVDIGRRIADKRDDMHYLGMQEADVWLTPECRMKVLHPLDGASYALSYAPQKMLDSFTGGEKPNILILGHHHKAFYLFYRNVHSIEAGTYCAQTPWMRGKRIAAMVGGWIVEVCVAETGEVTRIKNEFLPVYKTTEKDY